MNRGTEHNTNLKAYTFISEKLFRLNETSMEVFWSLAYSYEILLVASEKEEKKYMQYSYSNRA